MQIGYTSLSLNIYIYIFSKYVRIFVQDLQSHINQSHGVKTYVTRAHLLLVKDYVCLLKLLVFLND